MVPRRACRSRMVCQFPLDDSCLLSIASFLLVRRFFCSERVWAREIDIHFIDILVLLFFVQATPDAWERWASLIDMGSPSDSQEL